METRQHWKEIDHNSSFFNFKVKFIEFSLIFSDNKQLKGIDSIN